MSFRNSYPEFNIKIQQDFMVKEKNIEESCNNL